MILIDIAHALTFGLGAAIFYGVLSGKIIGGKFDIETGREIRSDAALILPIAAGVILTTSGIGGLLQ